MCPGRGLISKVMDTMTNGMGEKGDPFPGSVSQQNLVGQGWLITAVPPRFWSGFAAGGGCAFCGCCAAGAR